jgi:hypothetical protein
LTTKGHDYGWNSKKRVISERCIVLLFNNAFTVNEPNPFPDSWPRIPESAAIYMNKIRIIVDFAHEHLN